MPQKRKECSLFFILGEYNYLINIKGLLIIPAKLWEYISSVCCQIKYTFDNGQAQFATTAECMGGIHELQTSAGITGRNN